MPTFPAAGPSRSASFCRCSTSTSTAYRAGVGLWDYAITLANFAMLALSIAPCRNEQFWIDLVDGRTADDSASSKSPERLPRRIVCWLRLDEEVRVGERLGMIKFGSRTQISLPIELVRESLVPHLGDTVHGGSTILLRLKDAPAV